MHAQVNEINAGKPDSLQVSIPLLPADSGKVKQDSLPPGHLKSSPDALDAKVVYSARDSMRFDLKEKKIYLFGNADVKYDNIHLTAEYIEIDWDRNQVRANGLPDSTGIIRGKPVFSQGAQQFNTDSMRYNFKTKKGRISGVLTKEGEGYLHGERVKKNERNEFYVRNGKYTTCDLPDHPHFYINASKIKVIPDNKIITGPANLVIEDVHTPLAVPFGLFPNSTTRKSGIIFPTYGESPALGFFLKDGGYYFGLSDYVDASLTGTIYSRGSWSLGAASNYNLRYRFQGNFSLGYSKILQGDPELLGSQVNNDFFIRWAHNQDPKSRPNSRFSANVQAGSNNYNFLNSLNPSTIVTNTFQSSISYSKTFANTPFSMVMSAGHSQNTATRVISLSLPEFQLNMNRLSATDMVRLLHKKDLPYKLKNQLDKLGFTYTLQSRNTIALADSLYGRPGWEQNFRNGVQHIIPISTSFQVFKYITVSPSFNYLSRFYFNSIEKYYDNLTQTLLTDTIRGFKAISEWNTGISASTRVYSFLQIGKNIIRHVMQPQISFRYQDDFSSLRYGYYGPGGTLGSYSPYENGIYGAPAVGKQGTVGLSFNNNLEAKIGSKADSTGLKKIVLLDAFNFGSGYNLAADSLNWQAVSISARTRLFKKLDFVYSSSYDMYVQDSLTKRRINTFELDQNGRLLRMLNTRFAFNTVLASAPPEKKTSSRGTPEQVEEINRNPGDYVDFSIPWQLTAGFNINITNTGTELVSSQVLNLTGEVNVTSKWRLGFSSGYDFRLKDFSFTSVDIYRDLHCWEMHFNWLPFGFRRSFNFSINVKSSVLQDLKMNRRRQWFDLQGQ